MFIVNGVSGSSLHCINFGAATDPACGSGGMFIQSAELVKSKQGSISSVNVYGQEKEAATYRLAKMNLALRGISHHLGDMSDSSFTNDLHKGLYFDYIMANPPFNLKGWYDENLQNDPRWTDYGTPPASNANYAWILHMLSHLKKSNGVAGFLLANGALNDSDTLEIRKRLIQNDKVEAIIVLPRELLITTDFSVTLWILNQNKKGGNYHGRNLRNREHEILFMDLRTWTENPVKRQSKKKVFLSSNDSKNTEDITINLVSKRLAEKLNTLSKQEKAREGGNPNGKGQRIITAYRRTEQMW